MDLQCFILSWLVCIDKSRIVWLLWGTCRAMSLLLVNGEMFFFDNL